MSDASYSGTLSFIVKWITVLLIVVMLFVIYVPKAVWKSEDQYRNLAHWKMLQLWDAEEAYHSLTGDYNTNLMDVMNFISQVRDSVLADSMYAGDQYIKFKNERHRITIPDFWAEAFDTMFAFPYMGKDSSLETIYTAVVPNENTGINDTTYYNKTKDRFIYADSLWTGWIIDTTTEMRYENVQKYKRFNLVDSMMICPLTRKPYTVKDLPDGKISIVSPTKGGLNFSVHTFWTFVDTGHGSIIDGVPTWKK